MEGFLPWYWCLFWFLVSLPFLALGAMKIKRIFAENPIQKLTIALSGAFIFIFSALKIPSVTGSSSHPTGTGLSTVLNGPFVTSVLSFIVLTFQALLIAHGGLTTLGANVFSMGIAGPLMAYAIYKVMQKANLSMAVSVFTAAVVADFFTYVVTSFQLALAYPSDGSVFASFYTFFVVFAVTQIPLAIAEGILIVIFFDFLARTRPETIKDKVRRIEKAPNYRTVYAMGIAFIAFMIGIAVILNPSSGFTGTDDRGGEMISQITGGFTPWMNSLWSPSEIQIYFLLLIQAALGIGLLLLFLRKTRRSKENRNEVHRDVISSKRTEGTGNVPIADIAFSSPARNWPPLGKLALVLALLLVSLVASSVYVPALVLLIGFALLFYSTRFHLPRVLVLVIVDAMIVFAVSTVVIAFVVQGSGAPLIHIEVGGLILNLYPQGAEIALLVLLRASAGLLVMLFFATSTPIPHLAQALRQLHFPRYLIELVVLVYRYAFLLLEQLETMYTAAQCRVGFRGTRNKLRTTGKLAVGMFIRSMDVADRSQTALYCRNFHGEFPVFRQPAKLNAAWVALPLFVFSSLYALNYLIANPGIIGL